MRCYTDLHIHSCLSPCGDELMTPNNIVNMARLKGLDLIAVTDHNTARQLPSVKQVADEVGLGLLPGMEITTLEEAHLLAYFRTVEEAVAFSDWLYPHIPPIPASPELFGEELELNAEDETVRQEEKLLISAVDLSIDKLVPQILGAGGLAVPAHINRGSNGILQALGFLPPDLPFSALEVSRGLPLPHKGIPPLPILYSSDAHYLENILEREVALELDSPDADSFFRFLRQPI